MDDQPRPEPHENNSPPEYQAPTVFQAPPVFQAPTAPEAPREAQPRRRFRLRYLWLLLIPLVLCAAAAALAVSVLVPLVARLQPVDLPVTGAEPATPEQHTQAAPSPSATERPRATAIPPGAGVSYHTLATNTLSTCMDTFHEFLQVEELAAHEPAVLDDNTFIENSKQVLATFRSDCGALEKLPKPPAAYVEVDQWLKMAAAEVTPAADSFDQLLSGNQPGAMRAAIRHLIRFAEYAGNAEQSLNSMGERKQI